MEPVKHDALQEIESFRSRFKTGLNLPDLRTGSASDAVEHTTSPTTLGRRGEAPRELNWER